MKERKDVRTLEDMKLNLARMMFLFGAAKDPDEDKTVETLKEILYSVDYGIGLIEDSLILKDAIDENRDKVIKFIAPYSNVDCYAGYPLKVALFGKNYDIVKFLINQGATVRMLEDYNHRKSGYRLYMQMGKEDMAEREINPKYVKFPLDNESYQGQVESEMYDYLKERWEEEKKQLWREVKYILENIKYENTDRLKEEMNGDITYLYAYLIPHGYDMDGDDFKVGVLSYDTLNETFSSPILFGTNQERENSKRKNNTETIKNKESHKNTNDKENFE